MRVLLVDDDADLLQITARRIEKNGFSVTQAETFQGAANQINEAYDIILSDFHLDFGSSGIDLALLFRASGFAGKFFLLTGDDTASIKLDETLKTDPHFFLVAKPFSFDELIKKMKAA